MSNEMTGRLAGLKYLVGIRLQYSFYVIFITPPMDIDLGGRVIDWMYWKARESKFTFESRCEMMST
jgi:predicted membrane-bound dolichyl-phosphate-mannose-protein mannosyltransferase